jgi:hypothetical protein
MPDPSYKKLQEMVGDLRVIEKECNGTLNSVSSVPTSKFDECFNIFQQQIVDIENSLNRLADVNENESHIRLQLKNNIRQKKIKTVKPN